MLDSQTYINRELDTEWGGVRQMPNHTDVETLVNRSTYVVQARLINGRRILISHFAQPDGQVEVDARNPGKLKQWIEIRNTDGGWTTTQRDQRTLPLANHS